MLLFFFVQRFRKLPLALALMFTLVFCVPQFVSLFPTFEVAYDLSHPRRSKERSATGSSQPFASYLLALHSRSPTCAAPDLHSSPSSSKSASLVLQKPSGRLGCPQETWSMIQQVNMLSELNNFLLLLCLAVLSLGGGFLSYTCTARSLRQWQSVWFSLMSCYSVKSWSVSLTRFHSSLSLFCAVSWNSHDLGSTAEKMSHLDTACFLWNP